MPYRRSERLQEETTSRMGHMEVVKSPLVRKLLESFRNNYPNESSYNTKWLPLPISGEPLSKIFSVDGSLQIIRSDYPPYRELAFVKTALLKLDQAALGKINTENPNPFALKDILTESVTYHATVFPLRNVSVEGMNNYEAIRQIIFDSINDPQLQSQAIETLKWIVYEKWDGKKKNSQEFECPHCETELARLPYDAVEGQCPNCHGKLLLTDYFGFHLDMARDSAPDTIATMYMNIHESLLLFSGIRYFWDNNKKLLSKCLFVKDGPLQFPSQYSKFVIPIRRFLSYSRDQGCPVNLIGQSKTGQFCDHIELIGKKAPDNSIFIPQDQYIRENIQHRPNRGSPYGSRTNYGARIFVKINGYHEMVLDIPTGEYEQDPVLSELIGAEPIFATLPKILSNRHEGALVPLELAHSVASLSTYPSARILKIFSETF